MNFGITKITNTAVTNDIGQFRFGESDDTKKRLSAVSNTNKFRQETGCTQLNVGYGAIVMGIINIIRRATKNIVDISLISVGTKQYIRTHW